MRTGRLNPVFLLGLMAALLAACGGGGEYGDVKKALESFTGSMDTFIRAMGSAEDAGAVAGAVNDFADKMEALKPKMQELRKEYPEFEDDANLPGELRVYVDKMKNLGPQMMTAFQKVDKFKSDPEVTKARERIDAIMQ